MIKFLEGLHNVLQQLDDVTLSQTYRVLSLAFFDIYEWEIKSRNIKTYNYM